MDALDVLGGKEPKLWDCSVAVDTLREVTMRLEERFMAEVEQLDEDTLEELEQYRQGVEWWLDNAPLPLREGILRALPAQVRGSIGEWTEHQKAFLPRKEREETK